MESRSWKSVEITRMVVVQVGQDDILDLVRIDVERTERLHRATQEGSFSLLRDFGVESGIDDEGAASPFASHMK